MLGVMVPRRSAMLAAALAVTALVAIAAVTYYRSWSREQEAAGGWPRPDPDQLGPLSASAPTGAALTRQLFSYMETPSAWCRRLAPFGGSCGADGALSGLSLVCLDAAYAPQSGACLVYVASVAREWGFAAHAARFGCEVHALDPTFDSSVSGKATSGVQFQRARLGAGAGASDTTLTQLMTSLGHGGHVLDFLRVDMDGGEWAWLASDLQSLKNVRQLGMRVHLSLDRLATYHSVLRRVHQLGFRTVHSSSSSPVTGRDWSAEGVEPKEPVVYDIVWVNRRLCIGTFGCAN